MISIILQNNFIEIALCHGCSPVNLLHILRTPFPRNTSGWLLLKDVKKLSLRFKFVPANISCFPRRLQRNTFRLPRRLQDVFKTCLQDVLQLCLQDVFKTCLQDVLQLCLQDVFKTSSRRRGRQKNVTLKTS